MVAFVMLHVAFSGFHLPVGMTNIVKWDVQEIATKEIEECTPLYKAGLELDRCR